jgi:hypothetical protein
VIKLLQQKVNDVEVSDEVAQAIKSL